VKGHEPNTVFAEATLMIWARSKMTAMALPKTAAAPLK
jgi:hypothetical protein